MAAPKLGTGATLTFASVFSNTSPILSIDMNLYNRESIQTSHLGTTGAHTYIPGSLYDPGEITFEMQADDYAYGTPAIASASSLVITWGDGTITVNAFMTGMTWNVPLEELQTVSITLKLTSTISIT